MIGAGAGANGGFFAGDLADVALYPLALTRAHVAADYADGTHAACATITEAQAPPIRPVLADLGDTLSVTVTVTGTAHSATIEGQSEGPVDDGHGNVALATIEDPGEGETVGGIVGRERRRPRPPGGPDRVRRGRAVPLCQGGRNPLPVHLVHARGVQRVAHSEREAVGAGRLDAGGAQVTVTVHNATVYPTPLSFGEESMYAELNEGEEATAQDLLENVWPARGFPLPYLSWPLTWEEDPYHEAYWEFYFYGLRPEATLLYEWETTGPGRLPGKADRGPALVRRLRRHAAGRHGHVRQRPHLRLPHDGADQLLREAEGRARAPSDLEAGMARSLQKLGGFLAESQHFEADYNHGFNEGAALLLLADNFPHMPGAAAGGRWRLNG